MLLLAFLLGATFAHIALGDTATVTIDTNSLSHIYSGSPCPVTVTTQPTGLTVVVQYEGNTNAPIESGYYEVIATVTEPGWTGADTNYLIVDRAPQTVQFSLPAASVATSVVLLVATSTSGQFPAFGVLSGPGEIQGNILLFTNQGACVVTACVNGNENWRDACTTATVQVSRATALVTLINLTQSYSGEALEPDVYTTPDYLPVEIFYNGSTQAPVNVGQYTVVAGITDPQWSGIVTEQFSIVRGEQYMLFENPGICERTNTPELMAGTTSMLPPEFTLIEGPATIYMTNESYYVRFSATGRVSITASNPGNENWLPANTVTNTFYVYESPIHIQVEDDVAIYDGSTHAVTLLLPDGSGLTTNDIAVTYDGSTTPPTDAGLYEIAALITNPPSLHGGYIGTMMILKALDEITFDPPETIIATQHIGLAATALSTRPCLFYAEPEQTVRIDNGTNLVFLAAGDALVCAYVETNDNWVEDEVWVWITATKAEMTVNLSNLFQPFDGTPRIVTGQADAPTVNILYDGSSQSPSAAGRYTVTGILDNPIYQGGATGTLIVLERPEISIAHSNETIHLAWLAETGLFYSVQSAAPNFTAWNDLPPFTNLTGNGQLTADITATNAANFRVVAFP